jgi:hypothetical protein
MENSIAKSLLKAQSAMPKLEKDQENPFFKSKYVTLDQVLNKVVPVLNKNGIILSQSVSFTEDATPTLITQLIHESGDKLSSEMLLQVKTADPQAQGSAITYARRYALVSMLGLSVGEDDDGNAAAASNERQQENDRMQTNPAALVEMGKMLEDKGITEKEDKAILFEALTPGRNWKKLNTAGITSLKKAIMTAAPDTLQTVLANQKGETV